LFCSEIHVGRASASASAATTNERSVACNSCWASDRSVSETTRRRKNTGAIAASASHCGASRSNGRPGSESTWITGRPSIHVEIRSHSPTPAAIVTKPSDTERRRRVID
jgi:hypothetical protein